VDRRSRQNGQNIVLDVNKQQNSLKKTRTEEKNDQIKEVQCYECEGYGHIRTKCGTYLRKQKKSLMVAWSDEVSEEEDEPVRHATALTGVCISDAEFDDDEEITFEELASSYKDLLTRYEEVCRILEKQKKSINQLQTEKNIQLDKVLKAENEVVQANAQMDGLRKQVSQLNPGTNLLEEILGGVPSGRPKFVGYNYDVLNQHQQNIETKFIPAEEVLDPYTGKMMLQHPIQHPKIYPMVKIGQGSKTFSKHPRTPGHHGRSCKWICHHCGKKGHIRPFCYKLNGYPNHRQKPKTSYGVGAGKKEWKPKSENVGLIAHTSLRASSREDWYFDSGCSRHMTGVEKIFEGSKGIYILLCDFWRWSQR
jgi:hypothetical protein